MKLLKDILKGVVIGISNIIPGVSGGTMAVSMGIYDTIISAVTNLFHSFKKSVKTLLPYFIGMGIGIVGLSFLIEYLFKHFPLQTSCLFIGLILGGLPLITSKFKGKKISVIHVILFVIFFAIIIGLQLLNGESIQSLKTSFDLLQTLRLFIVGIIASATMVIPGVSGSLILMTLGYYKPVIETINNFITGLTAFDSAAIIEGIIILLPFGIGVLVGIFAIAKLIDFLLNSFELYTYSGILGLIVASPIAILMGTKDVKFTFLTIITSIVTLLIGGFIAYKLGNSKEAEEK